jgi:hypothetical protein
VGRRRKLLINVGFIRRASVSFFYLSLQSRWMDGGRKTSTQKTPGHSWDSGLLIGLMLLLLCCCRLDYHFQTVLLCNCVPQNIGSIKAAQDMKLLETTYKIFVYGICAVLQWYPTFAKCI